jgi:hypothetical protein
MTEKIPMKINLLISIMFLLFGTSFSQVNWVKYPSNPVMTKGPDNFDIIAIGQPTVLFENDTIKMWYVGVGSDMKGRICYAYSTDGIQWNKLDSAVIDVGNPGEWDCGWLDTPEIVRDPSGYKMYYYGDTAQQNAAISSAIGVAFSADGIHWAKHPGNPVFTKGNPGEWDCTWVESPAVIYDDSSSEYQMWYNGVDTSTWKIQIGLATSIDGINWIRYTGNPVVSTGSWGTYDDIWLGTPAVLKENGTYKMWYSSASTVSYDTVTEKFDTIAICYATSDDGISWIKFAGNPLLNTYSPPSDTSIDNGGPWACDVIYDPNENNYKMWYETQAGFCYATSNVTTAIYNFTPIEKDNIIIYPNPASDAVTIENRSGDFSSNDHFELFDDLGKKIYSEHINTKSAVIIDLRKYPSGHYFAKVYSGSNIQTNKIEVIK